jgi:CubicO group peptidase (beta-lactamase class C family)
MTLHRRWGGCALTMTLGLGISDPVAAQSAPPIPSPPAALQTLLDRYVAANPGAALIVGVVNGEKVTIYRAGTTPSGLNERTEYQIGSVTKTFTATLLALMAADGSVGLDDPLARYLPPGSTVPSYQGRKITLIDLAEQNSGLPAIPDNLVITDVLNPYAGYTPAKLHAFLKSYRLTRAPGTQYEYSNVGVGLLGDLLAYRAQTTYPQLLKHRVLDPLGLHDTAFALNAAQRARLAPGFTVDNDPQPPWTFGELAAAGALYSDLHDMLIFLRANMAAPNGTLGAAMASARKTRFPIGFDGIVKIGLVWMTNERTGISWHNGQTGGYHSYVAFNPAQQRGVVLLANVADIGLDALGLHALVPEFPVPAARTAIPLAPEVLDRLVGTYQIAAAPGITLTIAHSGPRLSVQLTGQPPVSMYATSPTEFFLKAVDAQLTFDVDAQGNATRVTLHQNGHDLAADRAK